MIRFLAIATFGLCLLVSSLGAAARSPTVLFLNPGSASGSDLWQPLARAMAQAARQLGLDLEQLYAERDRERMLQLARDIANRPTPPDYLLLVNEQQQAPAILEVLSAIPTRVLLLHNDLTLEQRHAIGQERQTFPNWIGTLLPSERAVPAAMMSELYRRVGGEPQVLGLTGDAATPISSQVTRVMEDLVRAAGKGRTLQIVNGNWRREDAAAKARAMLARYPEANLFWAANDTMALGILDALATIPHRNIAVGSLGGFPQGLNAVESGQLDVTVAGPVLSGAWAMVLIHDHAKGRDFAPLHGLRLFYDTALTVKSPEIAARVRTLVEEPEIVDFRRFALAAQPPGRHYDFSAEAVAAALVRR